MGESWGFVIEVASSVWWLGLIWRFNFDICVIYFVSFYYNLK